MGLAGSNSRSFTLFEVLISIIILTVGTVALARMFSIGLFAVTDVENIDLALNIARSKLENIYGTTGGVADEAVYVDPNFPDFSVGVVTDDNNPERVDVTVYWNTKGGQTSVTLTTLVTDY